MHLSSITLKNFRCFGPEPTAISFDKLAVMIGANGAGKSSVLLALSRMFGPSSERRVAKSDFHLPHDVKASEMSKTSLMLEVRIDLPELDDQMQKAWQVAVDLFAKERPMEADTIKAVKLSSWSGATIEVTIPKSLEKKLYFLKSPRNLELLQNSLRESLGEQAVLNFVVETPGSMNLAEQNIPEVFDQMVVSQIGETPFCRIRLEATWSPNLLAEGDIESEALYWIRTSSEEVADTEKSKVSTPATSGQADRA